MSSPSRSRYRDHYTPSPSPPYHASPSSTLHPPSSAHKPRSKPQSRSKRSVIDQHPAESIPPSVSPDKLGSSRSRMGMDEEEEVDELDSDPEPVSEVGRGSARQGASRGGERAARRCEWADCGEVFKEQPDLVKHLHDDHIGASRETYTCEWSGCRRKGDKQATRHSLITHCRAHTGERPYTCPQPNCSKTFTRSDAMSKHLRSLHGLTSDDVPKYRRSGTSAGGSSAKDPLMLTPLGSARPSLAGGSEGGMTRSRAGSDMGREGSVDGGGGDRGGDMGDRTEGSVKLEDLLLRQTPLPLSRATSSTDVPRLATDEGKEGGKRKAQPKQPGRPRGTGARSRHPPNIPPLESDTKPNIDDPSGASLQSPVFVRNMPTKPRESTSTRGGRGGRKTKVGTTSDSANTKGKKAFLLNPDSPISQQYRQLKGQSPSARSVSTTLGAGAGQPKEEEAYMRYGSDADLMQDDDLRDVIPRIRARFKPSASAAEVRAQVLVRNRYPRPGDKAGRRGGGSTAGVKQSGRGGKKRKVDTAAASQVDDGNGIGDTPNDGEAEDVDTDTSFDEGIAQFVADESRLEIGRVDEEGYAGYRAVYGRSLWGAKYVMAKAKLMLVEEEMRMRLDELEEWTRRERDVEEVWTRRLAGGAR